MKPVSVFPIMSVTETNDSGADEEKSCAEMCIEAKRKDNKKEKVRVKKEKE